MYFVYIRRRLKFFQSELAFETTLSHNIKSLKYCNNRIELLIKPLSVIELLNYDSESLIIGPRNEHDLYCLAGNGFNIKKIRGLDLISYSPRIDLGDMHETPYHDKQFDLIIVGWTLSYSRDPGKFASEILRIAKNNGVIAIGVEYSTMTDKDEVNLIGYSIQELDILNKRINSVAEILTLFKSSIKNIYFQHDAPMKRSHTSKGLIQDVSNVAVIFSIKKD